jgi:hypothetical protein
VPSEENIRNLRDELGVGEQSRSTYGGRAQLLKTAKPLAHANKGGVYRDRITARQNEAGLDQNVARPSPYKKMRPNPKTGELEIVEPSAKKDKGT